MKNLFEFKKLNDSGIEKCNFVRDLFNYFLIELMNVCPESPELDIIITKLQEACFFANKCISLQEYNHIEWIEK